MFKMHIYRFVPLAAALLFATAGLAQIEIQLRVGQKPGWDPRSRDGRCEIRVWVDHQAELSLRGDRISVRTLEGARSYDEGSVCSHPLPYNFIRDLQVRQIAGRNRVNLVQQPNRMNNFTAVFSINDNQGNGDHYAFEVTWNSDGNAQNAPAPFFDDIRACQDAVRQRFVSRNGRGAYLDFDGRADRRDQNRNREVIQGRGDAKNWSESRDLTYTCVVDTRSGQVRSAVYQYAGAGLRANSRNPLK